MGIRHARHRGMAKRVCRWGGANNLVDSDSRAAATEQTTGQESKPGFFRSFFELFFDHEKVNDDVHKQKG
jgi:hypothetical protein